MLTGVFILLTSVARMRYSIAFLVFVVVITLSEASLIRSKTLAEKRARNLLSALTRNLHLNERSGSPPEDGSPGSDAEPAPGTGGSAGGDAEPTSGAEEGGQGTPHGDGEAGEPCLTIHDISKALEDYVLENFDMGGGPDDGMGEITGDNPPPVKRAYIKSLLRLLESASKRRK